MIDEKKIEEAADKFAFVKNISDGVNDYDINLKKGFKAGISWFKKNLWHNASEEPRKHTIIYAMCPLAKGVWHRIIITSDDYKRKQKDLGIIRWLYVSDLEE